MRYADLPRSRRGGRLWVGVGGDDAGPLALPHPAPGCLVTGAPATGRSTTLAALAHALVDTGRRVVIVTETPGSPCWPTSPAVTVVARRGSRLPADQGLLPAEVTLVLDDGWLAVPGLDEQALAHLTDSGSGQHQDGGHHPGADGGGHGSDEWGAGLRVVAAVGGGELAVAFRGLVPALRDGGTVIALGARSWAGDPLGPAPPVPGTPPGRGLLGRAGSWQPVQVALPPSGESAPAARLAAVRQPA